jgi:hypothetical protein
MTTKTGRRLVIDTCICQSAGNEYATEEMSIYCRDILDCVYEHRYYFVCTPGIRSELSRHIKTKEMSKRGMEWLTKMASRGMVDLYDFSPNGDLRKRVKVACPDTRKRRELLKDIHLIEAANKTDNKIISKDIDAYQNFRSLAQDFDELQTVIWMDLNNHNVMKWLQAGAKNTKKYMLGAN